MKELLEGESGCFVVILICLTILAFCLNRCDERITRNEAMSAGYVQDVKDGKVIWVKKNDNPH